MNWIPGCYYLTSLWTCTVLLLCHLEQVLYTAVHCCMCETHSTERRRHNTGSAIHMVGCWFITKRMREVPKYKLCFSLLRHKCRFRWCIKRSGRHWLIITSGTRSKVAWTRSHTFTLMQKTAGHGSQACTVFARSEAEIMGSYPTQGLDV
jgi:hypothetical protein